MTSGEWESTRRLTEAAKAILQREHPMTIRQLFYRLVSAGVVENLLSDYRCVSRAMTKARHSGEVAPEWIVDRSRPTYEAATYEGLEEFGKVVARSYRRNYWTDQAFYLECWCEKDAVTGSIVGVTDEFGITLRALRGFNSTTGVLQLADLFARLREQAKQIQVFYLGDFDPSGMCIEEDVARRVESHMALNSNPIRLVLEGRILSKAFTMQELYELGQRHELRQDEGHELILRLACRKLGLKAKTALLPFAIRRLAIHREDIAKFRLPPLRVKDTDSRTPAFRDRHGTDCVELDALPPRELRQRLRRAIQAKIERTAWKRMIEVERAEQETTQRTLFRSSRRKLLHLRTERWSGRPDLNWGPLGPEPSALPGYATPRKSRYHVSSFRCQ